LLLLASMTKSMVNSIMNGMRKIIMNSMMNSTTKGMRKVMMNSMKNSMIPLP